MRSPVLDNRAIEAIRGSWPGAFRDARPPQDMERRTARAAQDLIDGHTHTIDQLFDEMDSLAPKVTWNPNEDSFEPAPLKFLLRYWHARLRKGMPPLSSGIDALELVPALGHIMLLEPVNGGADFRYRVYGSRIVEYSRVEMTGKCVSDIPSPMVAAYFIATYRAVLARRTTMYAHHRAHLDHHFAQWERLILPFVDEDGVVTRLMVGNVPRLSRTRRSFDLKDCR